MPDVQAARASISERLKEAGIEPTHRAAGALWTDDAFGAVMEKVEAMGVADNTIFIFSTDHGVGVTSGKFTCYQGGVRIPHTLKWKGHIEPGSTCDALLQNADFMPTMLDMAGVPLPESAAIDGISCWPQLQGAADERNELFFEWGYSRAVRVGKWKYIAYRPTAENLEKMKTGEVDRAFSLGGKLGADHCMHHYPHYFEPDQLYNLEADPGEQNNLVDKPEHADILSDLKARLEGHLATFDRPFDLSIDPFLTGPAYAELIKPQLADDGIYKTYFYLENAY
jgi:arylsulfatase A-like enzyme